MPAHPDLQAIETETLPRDVRVPPEMPFTALIFDVAADIVDADGGDRLRRTAELIRLLQASQPTYPHRTELDPYSSTEQ